MSSAGFAFLTQQCWQQVSDFRQMTTFTGNYYTVNYTTYSFRTFLANQSCTGCQLSDVLVTINR